MSLDYRTALLTVLLECGTEDIELLKGCNMCWEDIKKDCILNRGEITLNNLLQSIFNIGLDALKENIKFRVTELELGIGLDEDENDIEIELSAIKELDPFMDIETICDFQDTAVCFTQHEEAYRKYFSGDLDVFEEQTGFKIE